MLVSVFGASLAVSTFLGYLAGARSPYFLVLLAGFTFLSGLAWVAGPTARALATSNVAALVVTVTLPTSLATAAGHAAMIAFGAGVQLFMVVVFPASHWQARRRALADALDAQADYARRLVDDPFALVDVEPLTTARDAAFLPARAARSRHARLYSMRAIVERIRPELGALADPAFGAPVERQRVRDLLTAAASVLESVAEAIRNGGQVVLPSALTGSEGRLICLLQELVQAANRSAAASEPLLQPTLRTTFPHVLRQMRQECGRTGSPIFRHAVRVCVVVTAAYLIGMRLPLGHEYWAALAAVLIMRPDFSQTYSRAFARFCGTLVGVALASGFLHPGPYGSAVAAVCCAFLAFLLMSTGYAVVSACLAAHVVFLLGMAGLPWAQTARDRILLTLLGGALALVAYALYPAWESPRLRPRLADWLVAYGRYTAAVIDQYGDPARPAAEVHQALRETRAAWSAWQEALDKAAHEPVRHQALSSASADAAARALRQLGRTTMLLEAHLPDRGAAAVPAATEFAETLRRATSQAADAIRNHQPPTWTTLEPALHDWNGQGLPTQIHPAWPNLLSTTLTQLSTALTPPTHR